MCSPTFIVKDSGLDFSQSLRDSVALRESAVRTAARAHGAPADTLRHDVIDRMTPDQLRVYLHNVEGLPAVTANAADDATSLMEVYHTFNKDLAHITKGVLLFGISCAGLGLGVSMTSSLAGPLMTASGCAAFGTLLYTVHSAINLHRDARRGPRHMSCEAIEENLLIFTGAVKSHVTNWCARDEEVNTEVARRLEAQANPHAR